MTNDTYRSHSLLQRITYISLDTSHLLPTTTPWNVMTSSLQSHNFRSRRTNAPIVQYMAGQPILMYRVPCEYAQPPSNTIYPLLRVLPRDEASNTPAVHRNDIQHHDISTTNTANVVSLQPSMASITRFLPISQPDRQLTMNTSLRLKDNDDTNHYLDSHLYTQSPRDITLPPMPHCL